MSVTIQINLLKLPPRKIFGMQLMMFRLLRIRWRAERRVLLDMRPLQTIRDHRQQHGLHGLRIWALASHEHEHLLRSAAQV